MPAILTYLMFLCYIFVEQLWCGNLDALNQTFLNFVDNIFNKINFLKCMLQLCFVVTRV